MKFVFLFVSIFASIYGLAQSDSSVVNFLDSNQTVEKKFIVD